MTRLVDTFKRFMPRSGSDATDTASPPVHQPVQGETAAPRLVPREERDIYRTGRRPARPDLFASVSSLSSGASEAGNQQLVQGSTHRPSGDSGRDAASAAHAEVASGAVLATSSSTPAARTAAPVHPSPLESMQELARLTLHEVERLNLSDLGQIEKLAYRLYCYFPHSINELETLPAARTPEQNQKFLQEMSKLAADGSFEIVSQHYRDKNGKDGLGSVLAELEALPDSKERIAQLSGDNFSFLPADWKTRPDRGEDGIESRLSINVKPEHASALAEVFADLCRTKEPGFRVCKLMGPAVHGIRSETGSIYLSNTDPEKVAALSEKVHQALRAKIGVDAECDISAPQAPGARQIAPVIAYAEKAHGVDRGISSGKHRAAVVAEAVLAARFMSMGIEEALALCLAEHGYVASDPAFAKRPGEDKQAFADRVRILVGLPG